MKSVVDVLRELPVGVEFRLSGGGYSYRYEKLSDAFRYGGFEYIPVVYLNGDDFVYIKLDESLEAYGLVVDAE